MMKKRNRPVLSCTNCRNKKRKCNRESPCSTCIRFKLVSSCEYSTVSRALAKPTKPSMKPSKKIEAPSSNLTSELVNLRDRLEKIEASITVASLYNTMSSDESNIPGFKKMSRTSDINSQYPQVSPDDLIDLYCDFGNKSRIIVQSKRPVPLRTFSKRDPITRLFHKHKQTERFVMFFSSTVLGIENGNRSAIELRAQDHYGSSYIPRVDQKSDFDEIKKSITLFSTGGIKFKNVDFSSNLAQKIIAVLPNEVLFWELFDNFFSTLYPYFPVLDEFEMRENISRILQFSGSFVKNIKVESKHDLSILASILFLSRLSYLSTLVDSKDGSLNDFVAIECVNVAELCLKELDIYKSNDLSTLQAFILLGIYKIYAPEKGDLSSGGDISLNTGFLIQMAMSMGLNRDPSLFYDLQIDERLKNLRRKIWHFLLSMDEDDSLIYGTPSHVNPTSFDTEIPRFSSEMSNIKNVELEKDVVKAFRKVDSVFKKMRKVKDLTSALSGNIKVEVLISSISEVEQMIANDFGSLEELIKDAEGTFLSAKKIRLYILCKLFMMFVHYCLFLFYEKKENGRFKCFFLKRSLHIMYHDLSIIFNCIAEEKSFIPGFSLYVKPALMLYCHLAVMLGVVFCMRMKCIYHRIMQNDDNLKKYKSDSKFRDYMEKYNHLINSMKQLIIPKINLVISLSEKYWVAWNAIKVYIYCLKTQEKEELFLLGIQDIKHDIYDFSDNELDELLEIVHSDSFVTFQLSTDNMSPSNLAKLVQVDNMWFQLNKIQQEEDSIPKSFTYVNDKPIGFSDYPELDNINLFKQDFGFLSGIYFDDYIPRVE